MLIDHDVVDPATLPDESAIAAVTLAELAAGPHATGDAGERARRQDRLQWASAMWEPPVRYGGGTRLRSYWTPEIMGGTFALATAYSRGDTVGSVVLKGGRSVERY